MRHGKLAVAAIAATLALFATTTAASANDLSFSDRDLAFTWVSMSLFFPDLGEPECPVTFSGSLHRLTIPKVRATLIGAITQARVNTEVCVGGRITALQSSLPWHVLYDSFGGTLPLIATVRILIISASFAITLQGFPEIPACLMRSSTREPIKASFFTPEGGGTVQGLSSEDSLIETDDTTGTLCDLLGIRIIAYQGSALVEDTAGRSIAIDLI